MCYFHLDVRKLSLCPSAMLLEGTGYVQVSLYTIYTGSLFYLATIVCHIVLLLRCACGVVLVYHDKRSDMTRQQRVVR